MKIQFVLLFLFIPLFFTAQSFEFVFQSNEKPVIFSESIFPIENGEMILGVQEGGFFGSWGSFRFNIYKIDSLGNIIGSAIYNDGGEFSSIEKIIWKNGDHYFVIKNLGLCDFPATKTLEKITLLGEILWSKDIGNPSNKTGATIMDNGNILTSIENEYHIFSQDGIELQEGNLSIYDVFDVESDVQENIISVGIEGLSKISNTQETIYFDSLDFGHIDKIADDDFLLLHRNGLIKVDSNINIISAINFSQQDQFIKMANDNQNIYLFGFDGFGNVLLEKYDANLIFEETIIIGKENIIPTDIKISNNKIYLTGFHKDGTHLGFNFDLSSSYLYAPHSIITSSMWVKVIDLNNYQPATQPDIAITDISSDWVESIFNSYTYCSNSEFQNLKILVKNIGSIPVNQFNLNARFRNCSNICNSYSEFFEEKIIKLNPNEETEIVFPEFNISNWSTGIDSIELCFWLSSPDGKPDFNAFNNNYCKTFDVTTSIKNLKNDYQLKLYPNPVNELLSIDFPDELINESLTIEIFNIHGQLIKRTFSNNKKIEQILIQNLMEGIYFLHIKNENGNIFIEKFVKT